MTTFLDAVGLRASLILSPLFVMPALADPPMGPGWWYEGESPVVNSEANGVDHLALANIGQLKAMAWAAKLRMDSEFSSAFGAGREINQLVSAWFTDPQMTEPLPSEHFSPANIGQVKAVGKLFYDRLSEVQGSENTPSPPWTPETTDDSNYAAANLGQLKNVFSFELQSVEVLFKDTDSDSLNDWWELFYYGDLSSVGVSDLNSDADGDGRTLAVEAALGTNPHAGYDTTGPGPELIIFTPNEEP